MRIIRSLPMYARPFFLTLRVDNLPEIRKRQYENNAGVRAFRRNDAGYGAAQKRKTLAAFSAKRNAARVLMRRSIGKQIDLAGLESGQAVRVTSRAIQGTCRGAEQSSCRASFVTA
ncbi:MAG: hypothetical protein WB420_01040 [Bradyrhizobium sp.]